MLFQDADHEWQGGVFQAKSALNRPKGRRGEKEQEEEKEEEEDEEEEDEKEDEDESKRGWNIRVEGGKRERRRRTIGRERRRKRKITRRTWRRVEKWDERGNRGEESGGEGVKMREHEEVGLERGEGMSEARCGPKCCHLDSIFFRKKKQNKSRQIDSQTGR